MKKFLFALLVGCFALTACQPTAESYISELKDLVEKIAEEGSEYSEEQWEKISQEFDELLKKAEELEGLTEEQKKEIANLKGKFSGAMMKGGFDKLMKDASKELEKAGEAIKGFLDGIKEDE